MRSFCFGLLICAVCHGQATGDGFRFERFDAPSSLRLLKDAKVTNGVLRLVGARKSQTGAAWAQTAQQVSLGFESSFRFRLTSPAENEYGGADGFAFVLQTLGTTAIAGRGAAGGFSLGRGPGNPKTKAIPRSLAIFFDTFKNNEEQELSANSIGLFTNADGVYLPRRLALNSSAPVNLKDGMEHEVRIVYERPDLSVFLDQIAEPVLSASVDIASVTGSNGLAYVGFTAATGEGFQNHEILKWSFRPISSSVSSSIQFSSEACLPDRTLCTPAKATVTLLSPGRYSIHLPAHLEWPASLETTGLVQLAKIRGTVCWDPQSKAGNVCHGPEGNPAHPRDGLLNPAVTPGVIIQQRRGDRIYFSINAIQGAFAQNEGAFEFEVLTLTN